MVFRAHLNLCDYLIVSICMSGCLRVLADGVNEPEDEDAGGEYREFDPKDPNFRQEFAEDVDGGKSNLILFDACWSSF